MILVLDYGVQLVRQIGKRRFRNSECQALAEGAQRLALCAVVGTTSSGIGIGEQPGQGCAQTFVIQLMIDDGVKFGIVWNSAVHGFLPFVGGAHDGASIGMRYNNNPIFAE